MKNKPRKEKGSNPTNRPQKESSQQHMHTASPQKGQQSTSHSHGACNQEFKDLVRRIDAEVGGFLVLVKEGNWQQAEQAQIKAKTALLKYGQDLRKLATHLGNPVAESANKFLNAADQLVHSRVQWVDPASISRYREANELIHKRAA